MSSQIGTLPQRSGMWQAAWPVVAFAVAIAIVAAVIVGSFGADSVRENAKVGTLANTPTETRGSLMPQAKLGGTLANTPSEFRGGVVATSTLEALSRANNLGELHGAIGRPSDGSAFGRRSAQPKVEEP
ncbi:MAG TPA: hypothetical protein VLA90_00030, partial [Actinomycetota bacterium]|nr:hypothetical protein [Actinomycetota bacterium]